MSTRQERDARNEFRDHDTGADIRENQGITYPQEKALSQLPLPTANEVDSVIEIVRTAKKHIASEREKLRRHVEWCSSSQAFRVKGYRTFEEFAAKELYLHKRQATEMCTLTRIEQRLNEVRKDYPTRDGRFAFNENQLRTFQQRVRPGRQGAVLKAMLDTGEKMTAPLIVETAKQLGVFVPSNQPGRKGAEPTDAEVFYQNAITLFGSADAAFDALARLKKESR